MVPVVDLDMCGKFLSILPRLFSCFFRFTPEVINAASNGLVFGIYAIFVADNDDVTRNVGFVEPKTFSNDTLYSVSFNCFFDIFFCENKAKPSMIKLVITDKNAHVPTTELGTFIGINCVKNSLILFAYEQSISF